MEIRIYYEDTDCGGVVYYANYLKYFEEVRTEHLLSKGIDLNKLSKEGILFVIADVDIKYIGFDIGEKYMVGYGLDYKQKFRNLESIYELNIDMRCYYDIGFI